MTLAVLYLLATLDGILCGIRTSMGRCPLIRKRNYYVRAAVIGIVGAQAASILALVALFLTYAISSHVSGLHSDLVSAAGRMLRVFLPYSGIVLLSLLVRTIPSVNIRSATSIFALGPLTAIRPLVMVAGVVFGIAGSSLAETRFLGCFILVLMLSNEIILNKIASRAQKAEINRLLQVAQNTKAV